MTRYVPYGWRYHHRDNAEQWSLCEELPLWLRNYRKSKPNEAERWWVVQRLYRRAFP